jgi:hypothetical protein
VQKIAPSAQNQDANLVTYRALPSMQKEPQMMMNVRITLKP